jgi:predicted ATPase
MRGEGALSFAPESVEPGDSVRWRLRLLGAVQVHAGRQALDRLPSRAASALLARLALQPGRDHPREELVELLWPGVALEVGRNRLRQTLSTLKSLLEADGAPVIAADRMSVRLVSGAVSCDALQFEQAARAGRAAVAAALYRGELMPGHYDEWIVQERLRLQGLHERLATAPTPAPAAAPRPAWPAPPARPEPDSGAPLPMYLTRLFGADAAVARLADAVLAERLVTLLGAGGSGKTRLAVAAATRLRQAGAVRAVFVPLVAAGDAGALRAALARSLQLGAGHDDVDTLVDLLGGRRSLLVLDNFEQLVDEGTPLLAELLARLPELHLLVTSRRALGLDGEHCVAAEPLVPPEAGAGMSAAGNPAVALFVDRARAARADFHLHEGNAADIVRLVRALDGLPLAIELAASRVRAFAPAEMAARLDSASALPLLARSGPRGAFDRRHASMEQVIDWSWRLLSPAEQKVLAAVCVFEGGATAAAVAAVAEQADAALLLDALVSHSLVRVAPSAGAAPRFGVFEPVREFVAMRTADGAALRGRWRHWLLQWVRQLGALPMPREVAVELAQVHAAIPSAVQDGDPASALALALALRPYWDSDAMPERCLLALDAALPAVSAAQASAAHELLAWLHGEAGDTAAAQRHADAALLSACSDVDRARGLMRRGWLAITTGSTTGSAGGRPGGIAADLDEALALARRAGDRDAEARALHGLAVLLSRAEPERALALLAQSQALWLALGNRREAFARLRNRAQIRHNQGHLDEAWDTLLACQAAAQDDGDWIGLINCATSLAAQAGNRRQWARSVEAGRQCVAWCWQRGQMHSLAYALWNLPRPLAHQHRPEQAARLMAFTSSWWAQRFGALSAADRHYERVVRRLVQVQLGRARTEALWIDGRSLAPAGAVALALAD